MIQYNTIPKTGAMLGFRLGGIKSITDAYGLATRVGINLA
jgi:hypothetical protein